LTISSSPQTIHSGVLGLTTSVALQEYFLMALSQPRTEVESSSSDEEGEVEADQELEQLDSPAARMYRKSMVFQQDQKKIREEVTKHKRSAFIPVCCYAPDLAEGCGVLSKFDLFMLTLVLALPLVNWLSSVVFLLEQLCVSCSISCTAATVTYTAITAALV